MNDICNVVGNSNGVHGSCKLNPKSNAHPVPLCSAVITICGVVTLVGLVISAVAANPGHAPGIIWKKKLNTGSQQLVSEPEGYVTHADNDIFAALENVVLGFGIAKQPKSKDCGGKNGIVGVALIGAGTDDIVQFSIREPEMAPILAMGQSALNGKALLIMGSPGCNTICPHGISRAVPFQRLGCTCHR